MRLVHYIVVVVIAGGASIPLTAHAQTTQAFPEDLFNHLYWSAQGTHVNQLLGCSGLDTIGYVNDTIRHAFALGMDGGSSYIFNRFPGDTTRQYKFPGQKVLRANFNGDKYPDFACWDKQAQQITVLFGTRDPIAFDTVLVLQDSNDYYRFLEGKIVVSDCDADGFDDMLVSDALVRNSGGGYIGRLQFFKGGPLMSKHASMELKGSEPANSIGGYLGVGHIHDKKTMEIYEIRFPYPYRDTLSIEEYLLGPMFSLIPNDTVVLEVQMAGVVSTGFLDINGDSVDDVVIGVNNEVSVFQGGGAISRQPTFAFHKPFSTSAQTFGRYVVDVGFVASPNFHTILITDPDASYMGSGNGAATLFNIGKGLADRCVGYAVGPWGNNEAFGSQVIPLGDLDGDGLGEFAIGAKIGLDNEGKVFVFRGSGAFVGVESPIVPPSSQQFLQVYPNPSFGETTVAYRVGDAPVHHTSATLSISDMLGRVVRTQQVVDVDRDVHRVPISLQHLPSGEYMCRLAFSGSTLTRLLHVLH